MVILRSVFRSAYYVILYRNIHVAWQDKSCGTALRNTRYAILSPPSFFLFCQNDRSDHRDQQQNGSHFKRQEILVEQGHSHFAQEVRAVDRRVGMGHRAGRHAAESQQINRLHCQHKGKSSRQRFLPRENLTRRKLLRAQQHDDEQEQHHDGARIHRDLRHGNERRAEQDVEDRHRGKVQHEEQRRVDRVAAQQHAERARNGNEGKNEEDN